MHITEECGISVSPGSPDATVQKLASALEQLYADEPMRLRLGHGGQERAAKMYHWDKLGDQLKIVYQHALDPGDNV
jgi:glycosyltransferase involved in cell wall biosynthesis